MATATFRNDNDQDVYVHSRRIRKGAGVQVNPDSDFGRDVAAVPNMTSVTGDDAKALLGLEPTVPTAPSALGDLGNSVAKATAALTTAAVSAPLQIVVGDDQAPYGPPTGVVTTKQALAAESEEGYAHFAPGEPRPGSDDAVQEGADGTSPHGVPVHADVHNAQVANRESVEEIARQLAGDEGDDGDEDGDDLKSLNRKPLNALATDEGVEAPEKLPNRQAVIDAIREKRAESAPTT